MARKIKPATEADVLLVETALALLKRARRLLILAEAPNTVKRVRLAITSAGGALRHVQRRTRAQPPRGSLTQLPLPLQEQAEVGSGS